MQSDSQNMRESLLPFILINTIQKMSSFKSNENIHKKEDGPYYVVSANKASSVTCNDSATKARGNKLQLCEFQIGSRFKTKFSIMK